MLDYYKILEVDRNASLEVIEKAFKTLARKYHPDCNPPENEVWSKQKMQKLNEAYQALMDPQKRQLYDELSTPSFDLWLKEGLIGVFKQWLERQKI